MARLSYSTQALIDLERLADFLVESDAASARSTIGLIVDAVRILGDHPLIGRAVEDGLRELVVSRGRTGYVALYAFEAAFDAVLILAVRHQREIGTVDDDAH